MSAATTLAQAMAALMKLPNVDSVEEYGTNFEIVESFLRAALSTPQQPAPAWQPIATAPMDGTEILVCQEGADPFVIRYTSLNAFLTEKEIEEYDEETLFKKDWFYADFVHGGRLEGNEIPTHWMPFPAAPKATK